MAKIDAKAHATGALQQSPEGLNRIAAGDRKPDEHRRELVDRCARITPAEVERHLGETFAFNVYPVADVAPPPGELHVDWHMYSQKLDTADQMVARVGFFSATLSTSGAEEAILRLAAGEVDLLIVYSSAHTRLLIDQERFDWLSVAREVLVPVSALDAKGRARYRLTGGPAPIPWLAFTRTLTLRAVLARHLAEMPNRPMLKPVYQADSYEAILAMARRGTGIAWLPQRLVADDVARGTLAIVGGKDWQIGFDIALYRRAHQPHNVLDAIWQSARQASGDDA